MGTLNLALGRAPEGKEKVAPAGIKHTSWPSELQSKESPKDMRSLGPGEVPRKESGRVRSS